ncbi:cyclic nucleotide-binding domain-containing protein [bacterium]|nr:cyclic nucleotide-binding domain-containing protein [bacterium]NUN45615.1 cyclic nucleotide-binding domain-containing protein [bacterium]
MIQIGEILKQVPFFRSLGRDSIDFITEKLKFKQYKNGTPICKIGDPGDKMWIVLSGKVAVSAANGEVLAQIGQGNYFGEMALLTGEPRSATVSAADDTETFILDKDDFDIILEKYPSISIAMSKIMSQRLRETNAVVSEKAKELKSQAPAGPSGSLRDKHITEVLAFCEANSLTGALEVSNAGQTAVIEFEKGVLQTIKFGTLGEDEAMDTLMGWEDGTFVVKPRLIALDGLSSGGSTEAPKQESKKTGSILVINHSMVVRKVLEKNLSSLGHTVKTADGITDGIGALRTVKPNVIISDFKYDEISGYDFCMQIRETANYLDIPFIFITDSSTDSAVVNQLKSVSNSAVVDAQDVSHIANTIEKMLP